MDFNSASLILSSANQFLVDPSLILVTGFTSAPGLVLFTIHFSQRKAGCKCIRSFLGLPTRIRQSQRHLHTHPPHTHTLLQELEVQPDVVKRETEWIRKLCSECSPFPAPATLTPDGTVHFGFSNELENHVLHMHMEVHGLPRWCWQ